MAELEDFAIAGNVETKRAKPSIAGVVCPFFGVDTLKSTGDSTISLIKTKVRGARGILQKHSHKYSSHSFLDPIVIELWLVPAWVLGGQRLAAIISLYNLSFNLNDTTVG